MLFGWEAALLVATLACAAGESGHEVVQLDAEEPVQPLLGGVATVDNTAAAGSGPRVIVAQAKAKLDALREEEQRKALAVANRTEKEGKEFLGANEVATAKVRKDLEEKVADFEAVKNPPQSTNSTANPVPSQEVIQEKKAALQSTHDRIKNLETSIADTEVKVAEANSKAAFERQQEAEARKDAHAKEAAQKKKDIVDTARKKSATATQEAREKKSAKQEKQDAKDAAISKAERGIERVKDQQQKQEQEDEAKLNLLKARLQQEETMRAHEESNLKHNKAQESKATLEEAVEKGKLDVAQLKVKESNAQKNDDAAGENDAKSGAIRGQAITAKAEQLEQFNKERIEDAAKMTAATYKRLQQEKHSEAMDKKQVETAHETILAMDHQVSRMETKKALVEQFGIELRAKADADSEAAKKALSSAQAEYTLEKLKFDRATALVTQHQKQVEHDETARGKALKNVLAALDDGHVGNAISSGEQHEQADRIVQASVKKKEDAEHEARVYLTRIQHARIRENQALHLQTLADKEYNQAASNDRLLNEQVQSLQKLKAEQKVRKDRASEILSKADHRIALAEKDYHQAQNIYQSRLAASRYLKDVRLKVANKLLTGSRHSLKSATKAEGVDDGEVMSAAGQAEQAKNAMESASEAAKTAAKQVEQGEESVSKRNLQINALKMEVIAAKNQLQKNKDEGQIKMEKGNLKLMEAKNPVVQENPSQGNSEEQQVARNNLETSVDRAKEVAERVQDEKDSSNVKELDDASDKVEKAKKAYHDAFGSDKSVPGHDDAVEAIKKAKATVSPS